MRLENAFVAVLGLIAGGSALASPAFISNIQLTGDCEFDDIRVVEEGGEYYIAAYFDSIFAQSHSGKPFDKKRCTMNYDVKLAPNYKLDLFQFSVNGTYELSEQGSARLTVSHRAANGKSVRTTEFYSLKNGSDYFGDIVDHTGDITRWDLKYEYQQCGSRIPMTSSIFVHAAQPDHDVSGQTVIVMDDGTSSQYTKLCKIIFNPCY